MSYIYLASPYTDPDPLIRELRYYQALRATADLLKVKQYVYSPIVHCHEVAKKHKLPTHFDFWQNYNFAMLRAASSFAILQADGWKESVGVLAESNEAIRLNLVRFYIPV